MSRKKLRYDPQNDYYQIVGVGAGANADEIQQAYRKKAKTLHPDLNPERAEWAKEQFQRLNEAYDILGNAETRHLYDQLRHPYLPSSGGARRISDDEWLYRPHPKSATPPMGDQRGGYRPSYRPAPPIPVQKPGAWLKQWGLGWLRPSYIIFVELANSPYRFLLGMLAILACMLLAVIITGIYLSATNPVVTPVVVTASPVSWQAPEGTIISYQEGKSPSLSLRG